MQILSYSSVETFILNLVVEMFPLSTHNICFGWEKRKLFLIKGWYLEAWSQPYHDKFIKYYCDINPYIIMKKESLQAYEEFVKLNLSD